MANEFTERMRSIGVLTGPRRDRVREGRSHPESGLPFKATIDDRGNTVTEHGAPGTGTSQRQDVLLRPETVRLKRGVDFE